MPYCIRNQTRLCIKPKELEKILAETEDKDIWRVIDNLCETCSEHPKKVKEI